MPPTYSECFLRTILFPIDFSIIGIIVIARSKKNQRIGDFAADTLVVYKSSNKETKIDFSNEFAYTKEGFKPKYKEAAQFTEKDISYIDRVLYNKILTLEEKLAKGFIKKYSIKKQWEEKDRDFLWRLKNDYSYYTNLEN